MAEAEFPALSLISEAPESVFHMPDSMHPTDRRFLVAELNKITTEVATLNAGHSGKFEILGQRLRAVNARLAKLESRADASGRHDIELLQKALDKQQAAAAVWRGRLWSIIATFLTTALIALVAHYLATR